jgi:hypothetical protein
LVWFFICTNYQLFKGALMLLSKFFMLLSLFFTIQSTLQNPALFQADAWINGHWVAGSLRFAVDNPASGEVIAQVSNLGASEAKVAIAAAEAALTVWAESLSWSKKPRHSAETLDGSAAQRSCSSSMKAAFEP